MISIYRCFIKEGGSEKQYTHDSKKDGRSYQKNKYKCVPKTIESTVNVMAAARKAKYHLMKL